MEFPLPIHSCNRQDQPLNTCPFSQTQVTQGILFDHRHPQNRMPPSCSRLRPPPPLPYLQRNPSVSFLQMLRDDGLGSLEHCWQHHLLAQMESSCGRGVSQHVHEQMRYVRLCPLLFRLSLYPPSLLVCVASLEVQR